MQTDKDSEFTAIERWKKVFFIWALFFTVLFLASLIISLRVHSSPGTGVVWAGLFTILYWLPGAFCGWKWYLAASILSLGIGVVWLVRVVSSYWVLVPMIRKPPVQGILPEVAMLLTGIAAVIVFLTGGIQIYRAVKILKADLNQGQEEETGLR
jgi:hypothetical protein